MSGPAEINFINSVTVDIISAYYARLLGDEINHCCFCMCQIAPRTRAGVHLGPADTSRRCTSMRCTARFDTCQLCRTAHSSTNRRPSLLCGRTTSVEQAADGAETAAVDRLLPPPSENIFVSICLRTLENELMVLRCALGLSVGGAI